MKVNIYLIVAKQKKRCIFYEIGRENQETLITIVESQKTGLSYASVSSAVGMSMLNMFGFFFNLVEVAQEMKLYTF